MKEIVIFLEKAKNVSITGIATEIQAIMYKALKKYKFKNKKYFVFLYNNIEIKKVLLNEKL